MAAPAILQIDTAHLDTELQRAASDHWEWSIKLSNAKAEMAAAENTLKLWKCRLSQKIREAPIAYGLSKVTEASLEEAVFAHADTQLHLETIRAAQGAIDKIAAITFSLTTKRESVNDLVRLHLQGYFMTPTPTQLSDAGEVTARNRRTRTRTRLEDAFDDDIPSGDAP